MFLTILSISGPSGVISAGLALLIGTLFHYSSRRKIQKRSKKRLLSAQESSDFDLKQKILLTTELLKELERRETLFQNWFENSIAKLNEQKNQITSLLHSADQTAAHLNKMINAFEETFLSPQASVVSVFNELESNLQNEVIQLEASTASLKPDYFDIIENESQLLPRNSKERSRQMINLAQSGLNSLEIAQKLRLSPKEVELNLNALGQTRKVA